MPGQRPAGGFTLVEMLVAIALLALMGIVSWRGLDHVSSQIQRIDSDAEEVGRVLRVLSQIERDLAQRLPDVMLPASSTARELPLSITVGSGGNVELEILRFAPTAAGPSRAQRVVYRIADQALERSVSPPGVGWPVALATHATTLLPARRLGVRAYAAGFWSEPGREPGVQPPTPASALEITVEDARGARYVRVLGL